MTLVYTVASFKILSMIVFDVKTRVLDTEIIIQHNIADLNSGIIFTVLFGQEKPLQWKEIRTQTPPLHPPNHPPTHTHTHTHTHIHTYTLTHIYTHVLEIKLRICKL